MLSVKILCFALIKLKNTFHTVIHSLRIRIILIHCLVLKIEPCHSYSIFEMEKCIFLKAVAHTLYYIKQSALTLMMFLYVMWKGDCHLTLFPLAAWSTKNTFILIHAASFYTYQLFVCTSMCTVQILYVWQIHFLHWHFTTILESPFNFFFGARVIQFHVQPFSL